MGLQPGTRAGHYEILGPLGAGGMAEVYRARDARLGREVALKVLPPEFAADPSRVQRFEREARAISMLNHPNILAVFDVGEHEGLPYLVTELLEGETLKQRMKYGALTVRKAVEYARQIAAGLAAAHERGVTHRDLKPDNLFLTRDGIVKILDFGLAKLTPSAGDAGGLAGDLATEMGATLGTAGYMSPEQVRGEPADNRSDIFSFGAVLYEMISGEGAFQAPTGAERLVKILNEDPPALTIPSGLDQVLRHCLEKSADDRFHSARDLGFALQSFSTSDLSGVTGTRARQAMPSRGEVVARRVAVGFALAALGLLAGHFIWKTREKLQPVYQQMTFRRGSVSTARFAKGGQTVVYGATWEGKPIEVFSVRPEYPESRSEGEPATALLSVTPAGELGILRHARYMHHVEWVGTLATLPLDGGAPRDLLDDVEGADWDPTAASPERVAVVRQDAATRKMRLEYPVGHVLYETSGWISHVRVSPQGDRVAFLDHPVVNDSLGSVAVVDAAGKLSTLSTGWAAAVGLAWSPKGDEVWFSATRAGSTLKIYAVTLEGRLREVLSAAGRLVLHDISPDGRLLVSAETLQSMLIPTIAGLAGERDLAWLDHSFRPHLSADGKKLLFTEGASAAGPHYSVCLRNVDGSPVLRLGEGTALGLSPDGKWALTVVTTTPGQLVLLPTGAGQPKTLERGEIESYGVGAWLPGGSRILFVANEPGQPQRAYLQEVAGGKPKRALREGFLPVAETISRDAREVACRREGENFMLCPLDGGEPQRLRGLETGEEPLGWTADGRSLYVGNLGRLPLDIYTVEAATGRRRLWKQINPTDAAGLTNATAITITPDGQAIVCNFMRKLNVLFTVQGVQ